MSEVSPWSVIQSIAERRIEESMAKGDFDDLPGRGKPLELEDDTVVNGPASPLPIPRSFPYFS